MKSNQDRTGLTFQSPLEVSSFPPKAAHFTGRADCSWLDQGYENRPQLISSACEILYQFIRLFFFLYANELQAVHFVRQEREKTQTSHSGTDSIARRFLWLIIFSAVILDGIL